MQRRILDIQGLQQLIDALAELGYEVLGPRVRDDAICLDTVEQVAQLPAGIVDEQEGGRYRLHPFETAEGVKPLFTHVVGPQGWKRFLHPPAERMWRTERTEVGIRVHPREEKADKRAFLGVRACELAAMAIQDRVLMQGRYADSGYVERRKALFIVAVNCTRAAATCFCHSMNSGPQVTSGHDLLLTELTGGGDHRFLVESGSEEGEALLESLPGREVSPADVEEKRRMLRSVVGQLQRSLPGNASALLEQGLEHPHWQEVAARCLHCGNCTAVCPTCFCTRMEERSSLTGDSAEHWRQWDSCFNESYSYIHGGAVRGSPASRYRQWITHKLLHWQAQFGTPGCTGCGRCITWCPVGIDVTAEVRALERGS